MTEKIRKLIICALFLPAVLYFVLVFGLSGNKEYCTSFVLGALMILGVIGGYCLFTATLLANGLGRKKAK
jgi:hypothetical protein